MKSFLLGHAACLLYVFFTTCFNIDKVCIVHIMYMVARSRNQYSHENPKMRSLLIVNEYK